jgi:hypothetical protein
MAGPDAGLADPVDPDQLRDVETDAVCTCGVHWRVTLAGDFLFPPRRWVVVCISSCYHAADPAASLSTE